MNVKLRGIKQFSNGRQSDRARSSYANRTMSRMSNNSTQGERMSEEIIILGTASRRTAISQFRVSMLKVMIRLA